MGRRDERDDESDVDSDVSTDSECEYQLDTDSLDRLAADYRVDAKTVADTFVKQSGLCRITGIPFDRNNQPVVVARKITQPIGGDNCMLVLDHVERMRESVGVGWRVFVRLLQIYAKDAEL